MGSPFCNCEAWNDRRRIKLILRAVVSQPASALTEARKKMTMRSLCIRTFFPNRSDLSLPFRATIWHMTFRQMRVPRTMLSASLIEDWQSRHTPDDV